MRPVALDDHFASIVLDIEPQARAKGLSLTWRRTGLSVVSDPLMLRRILQNLLVNAVQYTEKGGIRLLARRRGANVRIEVWDTGPGIGEADREMIFEEFQRGSATDRPAIGGFGLGLSIVQRMAEALGHPIDLCSRARPRHALFAHAHHRPDSGGSDADRNGARRHSISTSRRSPALRSPSSTTTRPCSTRCRGCSNAGTATCAARATSPASSRAAAPTASGPTSSSPTITSTTGATASTPCTRCALAVGAPIPAIIITADRSPAIADAARELRLRDAAEAGEAGGAARADAAPSRPRGTSAVAG